MTNFTCCQAMLLLECLATRPMISKLDLSGNEIANEVCLYSIQDDVECVLLNSITSGCFVLLQAANMLVKLLKGQLRIAKSVAVDARLQASFLGDVSVAGSSKSVATETLEAIRVVSCDAYPLLNQGFDLMFVAPFYSSRIACGTATRRPLCGASISDTMRR